jgi:glycosyltransferase involved in cell wall biosynthesis
MGSIPHPTRRARRHWIVRWLRRARFWLRLELFGSPEDRLATIDTVIPPDKSSGRTGRFSPEQLLWWAYEFEVQHAGTIRRFLERPLVWFFRPVVKRIYMRAVVKEVQQLALLEQAPQLRKRIAEIRASSHLREIESLRVILRCQIAMRREVKALATLQQLLSREDVGSDDFAEAMRICAAIGSPNHSHWVAARWARSDSSAFQDRFVQKIVTTLPDFEDSVAQWPAGSDDASHRFLPELLMPKLCRDYRPRRDFERGLVVEVTSSLGPGGAERQFINSIKAIKQAADDRALPRPPVAIVYRVRRRRDLGFFLRDLLRTGLTVHEASTIPQTEAIELLLHQNPEAQKVLDFIDLLPRNAQVVVLRYYYLLLLEKPEVVQIWQDDTNIHCGIAALLARVPRISFFTRSKRPTKFTRHRRYLRACYKDFLRLPNVSIVNNSLAGAEDYAAWLDVPRDRILTVYNGIDIDAFAADNTEVARQRIRAELGIPADAPVVGGIMRMSAEKQPLLWLEVAFRLAERFPTAHFVCLGDGPLAEEMRKRIEANPHRDRIHLPGSVHGVAAWYGLMTLVLCTSSVEGLPNIPIEAQSLGVPVAATDAGGTRETFVDGEGGYLCPIGDADALTAAAERILSDSEWQERAHKNGVAYCRQKFDFSVMRRNLLNALTWEQRATDAMT